MNHAARPSSTADLPRKSPPAVIVEPERSAMSSHMVMSFAAVKSNPARSSVPNVKTKYCPVLRRFRSAARVTVPLALFIVN